MPEGIIIKGVGGIYTVKCKYDMFFCKPRGLFRKSGIKPLPGDYVKFDITDEKDKEGYLLEILPRKNTLIRPAVANVDIAFLVVSVKNPEPDLILVDKLLCIFKQKEIETILCVNKMDLDKVDFLEQYEKAGCKIITMEAKNNKGVDKINEYIKDNVCIFAGQSGVGKSTILNAFLGDMVMETGAISEKINRGKHTTRHAQFIEYLGGFIVDTPGFSSLYADLLEPDDIKNLYTEFNEYDGNCRFSECIHINEPNCAVKEAVKKGVISEERYERYVKIYTQAKDAKIKRRGY